jgi:hypothetical protein
VGNLTAGCLEGCFSGRLEGLQAALREGAVEGDEKVRLAKSMDGLRRKKGCCCEDGLGVTMTMTMTRADERWSDRRGGGEKRWSDREGGRIERASDKVRLARRNNSQAAGNSGG